MTDRQQHRLIVDSSALLCRYLPDSRQSLVDDVMASADQIVVTALTRTEVELALHHALGSRLWWADGDPGARLDRDWDRFWVLPVDQRCLRRAADLGRTYSLNLVNSLQLAALDPTPRPATLLTVDDRQFAAAADLGFEVAEVESQGSAFGLLRSD